MEEGIETNVHFNDIPSSHRISRWSARAINEQNADRNPFGKSRFCVPQYKPMCNLV